MKNDANFAVHPFHHFARMSVNPEYKKTIDSINNVNTPKLQDPKDNQIIFSLPLVTQNLIG